MFYAKGIDIKDNNDVKIATEGTMSVYQHCVDAGLACKTLLEFVYKDTLTSIFINKLGADEKSIVECMSFFAALHDLGKIHLYFQINFDNAIDELVASSVISENEASIYRAKRKDYRIRHEVVTRKALMDEFKPFKRNKVFKGFCYALSSHHEKDNRVHERTIGKENDAFFVECQKELLDNLHTIFPFDMEKLNSFNISDVDTVCTAFLSILFLSDWIVSSDYFSNKDIDFFNICVENKEIEKYIEKRSTDIYNVIKNNLNLNPEKRIDLSTFSKIFGVEKPILRPVQKKVEDICKDKKFKFMLIEAPMGEGKTETALFAAGQMMNTYHKDGIYFALPTGATSDMLYERFKKICKEQGILDLNLLHSTSFLSEKLYNSTVDYGTGKGDIAHLLSSTRTGLLVPNAIGTVDQAMMAVLKSKFSGLRLLGLVNKVLVIDEIHSYDAFMNGPIYTLLSWCNSLDIPVVLLSATLSNKARKNLIKAYMGKDAVLTKKSYPLVTAITTDDEICEYSVDGSFMKKEIHFKPIRLRADRKNLKEAVLEEAKKGRNIAIICNTIGEAMMVKLLLGNIAGYDIELLHSSFKVKDRKNKESYVTEVLGKDLSKRKQNLIVIGTQVLEQSLDIDFDTMFTYLCPIDLLLQRIGRWRRFNIDSRVNDPIVYVVLPEEKFEYENSDCIKIYEEILLKWTEEYILNNPICTLPQDFRKCIEYVYDRVDLNDTAYLEKEAKDVALQILGETQAIKVSQGETFQRTLIPDTSADDIEFEAYSTRAGAKKKKIILMDKNDLTDKELQMLPIVKGKDFATKLFENSVSVYYNKFGDKVVDGGTYMELEGMLKGYSLFLMNNDSITIKTENNKTYTYTYSDDIGFVVEN